MAANYRTSRSHWRQLSALALSTAMLAACAPQPTGPDTDTTCCSRYAYCGRRIE